MDRIKNWLIIIITLGCIVLSGSSVFSADEEAILSFQSEITINQGGWMIVSEQIKIRSTGAQIKHGIYRDFPTKYQDHYGNKYSVGFKVIEVLRDNQPENYLIKNMNI
jgi:hypothetical protein